MSNNLRKLREAKGWRQEEAAERLGMSKSGYSKIERGEREMKAGFIERVAKLYSVSTSQVTRLVSDFDPDEPDFPVQDERGASFVDGAVVFEKSYDNGIPELAAAPGMGVGKFDNRPMQVYSNGVATGHPVLNEWVVPPDFIRHNLGAVPAKVVVMAVIGHSMSPILEPNDRIIVDISQQSWVGDAVYVIDDGDGVLRAKTLRKVSGTNPPQFKVVSEAAPTDIEILEHSQFRIVGRAVGRISKL